MTTAMHSITAPSPKTMPTSTAMGTMWPLILSPRRLTTAPGHYLQIRGSRSVAPRAFRKSARALLRLTRGQHFETSFVLSPGGILEA